MRSDLARIVFSTSAILVAIVPLGNSQSQLDTRTYGPITVVSSVDLMNSSFGTAVASKWNCSNSDCFMNTEMNAASNQDTSGVELSGARSFSCSNMKVDPLGRCPSHAPRCFADLSGIGLRRVPDLGVLYCANDIRFLSLARNQIEELAGVFDKLKYLTVLDLSGNKIKELPLQVFSKPAFTNADIGKEVSIEGDSVKIGGKPRDVKWIDAKHSDCSGKITSVEEKYKGRVRLEDGQEFENGSGKVVQLKKLMLNDNQIKELCLGVFNELAHLTELTLMNNQLKELWKGVFDVLTQLTLLWLDNNEIEGLVPGVLDRLTKLTHLSLGGNPFDPTTQDCCGSLKPCQALIRALPYGATSPPTPIQTWPPTPIRTLPPTHDPATPSTNSSAPIVPPTPTPTGLPTGLPTRFFVTSLPTPIPTPSPSPSPTSPPTWFGQPAPSAPPTTLIPAPAPLPTLAAWTPLDELPATEAPFRVPKWFTMDGSETSAAAKIMSPACALLLAAYLI